MFINFDDEAEYFRLFIYIIHSVAVCQFFYSNAMFPSRWKSGSFLFY